MIIKEEKYCIVSKTFPLKFHYRGIECDEIDNDILMSKEECEEELRGYDEPDEHQILKVNVTYEF